MEKKEKWKVRKNEGQGPYILRYPLLDGKAEYYYFDKKKQKTKKPQILSSSPFH